MKYTIENKGQGTVIIRVFVPESMAASFLEFIEQKAKEKTACNTALSRKSSSLHDENYFIRLNAMSKSLYESSITAGLSVSSAISETLKKIKVAGFYNVSYDGLKSVLTKQGCFRAKTPEKSRL